ncbi:GTPase HflX [Brackiella oedipodis]|uniref:GTPase HflX n=1 Tax=Brackiella oedipodis TaxID=124225 RepID=UPI0009FC4EB3|nr:GTPase HflX [Brackiella oedipodis]
MRGFVLGVNLGNLDFQAQHDEFLMLAKGAGAKVVGNLVANRERPDPAFFIGKGKLQEAVALAKAADAEIVLFDQPLSPAQQRNIEREFNLRVIDRVALILDIFALRAKSHEGKLQVELAQLQHLRTRLTRMWTHLERQKGGIGLRGPGESQLEMDRRVIGDKVKVLRQRLHKVQKQRQTQRRSRQRSDTFNVSLVGYTNAGKSTLFNALTKAKSYAADQLFATLDTTTRKVWVEGAGQVTLSDTVGFIRELPTTLIAAFKATLEETVEADVLLHVIDASSTERDAQILEVNKVLQEIGAEHVPILYVYNKIDLAGLPPKMEYDARGLPARIFVSSVERQGLQYIRQALALFKTHLDEQAKRQALAPSTDSVLQHSPYPSPEQAAHDIQSMDASALQQDPITPGTDDPS